MLLVVIYFCFMFFLNIMFFSDSGFLFGDFNFYIDLFDVNLCFVFNCYNELKVMDSGIEMWFIGNNDLDLDVLIVEQIVFLLDGKIVYVGIWLFEELVIVWDVLSGKCKVKSWLRRNCFFFVMDGVLLIISSGVFELWKFDFLKCI